MTLLHVSIPATDPEYTARTLARLLGVTALPFPPAPGAWIAFSEADDGTAVEVYPATTRIEKGPQTIAFSTGPAATEPTTVHAAIASPLPAETILTLGREAGWTARVCDRGPFQCVELWIDDRLLFEVLDPAMLSDYRAGMTSRNWRAMFGMHDAPKRGRP